MNKSETIAKLASALSKFQSQVEGAVKSSDNPFYKSKYADLATVWKTIREPLTVNGLSVAQVANESGDGFIAVETVLMHESGEWISGQLNMKLVKNDPQGAGSAITYARRYGLTAILGIHQEDDDANTHAQPKAPTPITITIDELNALAEKKTAHGSDERAHFAELIATSTTQEERIAIKRQLIAMKDITVSVAKDQISVTGTPSVIDLQKAISIELQRLIDADIDSYTQPNKRKNSFVKHLGAEKVSECHDAEKLSAYLEYLRGK